MAVEVFIRGRDQLSGVVADARKGGDDTADKFDRAGERADNMDTKAMGFRDTMTGVADTTLGASHIARGNLFEGFLTLGMGIGDLGSGLYNFVIPGLKGLRQGGLAGKVANLRAKAGASAHRVAERARGVAAAAGAAAQRTAALAKRNAPLLLIIAALTAIIMAVWRRSETLRRVVKRLWAVMKSAFRGAVDWVKRRFSDLLGWLRRLRAGLAVLWARTKATMTSIRTTVGSTVATIRRLLLRLGSIAVSAVAATHRAMSAAFDKWKRHVVNPLISAYNALPGVSDTPLLTTLADQQSAAANRFRQRRHGGRIPGTGNADNVPILATPGEHVMTREEVAAAGGHAAIERLRAGLRRRGRLWEHPTGGDPQRLARGGAVAVRRFARRYHGNTYLWAGTGPRFDCSGWISALLNVWEGKRPYFRRRFGTGTIAAGNGLKAGLAPDRMNFNIGSYRGNPGHMAATIDGTNAESGGSHGTSAFGGPADGARHPRFTQHFHATGGFDWIKWLKEKAADLLNRIASRLSGDSFALRIGRALIRIARDHIIGTFATGVDRLPRSGLAQVHAGETIDPSGGVPVVLEVVADDVEWQRWVNHRVRQHVRTRGGGSVQRALGGVG